MKEFIICRIAVIIVIYFMSKTNNSLPLVLTVLHSVFSHLPGMLLATVSFLAELSTKRFKFKASGRSVAVRP